MLWSTTRCRRTLLLAETQRDVSLRSPPLSPILSGFLGVDGVRPDVEVLDARHGVVDLNQAEH